MPTAKTLRSATDRRRCTTLALLWTSGALACGEAAPRSMDDGADAGIVGLDSGSTSIAEPDPTTGPAAKLDLGAPTDLPLPDGEDCASTSVGSSLRLRPIDVILVVDTSSSMQPVSNAVEQTLGTSLTQKLADSGLDYRVIAIAGYGAGAGLCLPAPLGQDDCNPPGPLAPVGPLLYQYSVGLGSGSFLEAIIGTYDTPPSAAQSSLYTVPPTGWGEWARPDALKVFIGITDAESMSNSIAGGTAFDANLLALAPEQFGTPEARNYVFHTIAGLAQNNPATLPWPPDAPIVNTDCVGFSGKEPGQPMQQVSVLSGGLRFPLCEYGAFDAVFDAVATGVVETVPASCDIAVPVPEDGGTIDPDTIEVDYHAGDGQTHVYHQVPNEAACDGEAFWLDGDAIHLCAAACTTVQADDGAQVDVRFGCDVGYDPNG